MAKKTDYNVSAEQFCKVWQSSASAQEAADQLKMPKDIVHARASMYRNAGIRLKKMPRHKTKALDIEGLNAMIEGADRAFFGRQSGGEMGSRSGGDLIAVAFSATFFDCPRCKSRTHIRDVCERREDGEHVVPGQTLVCQHCSYQLTPEEEEDVVGAGWWFTCLDCWRDSFVDETVEERTVRPPSMADCQHCGTTHSVGLADT